MRLQWCGIFEFASGFNSQSDESQIGNYFCPSGGMRRVLSIEQTNVIDFITFNDSSGEVLLTISDHLPWGGGKHLLLLQDKLNSYLRFVESGELLKMAPDATGRSVIINLVCKFEPNAQGKAFLSKASDAIQNAGFDLRLQLRLPN